MLRTLLESRSTRNRGFFGTAASTAIHLVLITAAAYGTVTHARAEEAADRADVVLHWTQPPVTSTAPTSRRTRSSAATGEIKVAKAPSISIDISPGIPDVQIPLGSVRSDDFPASTALAEGPASASSLGSGEKTGPYDSYEVDVPVSAIGGIAPAYPASMRAAGIEGEVKAEFVVDRNGRANPASLRIISSTNDLFSEAVRSALPRMRFNPARLKGDNVAQLVQQLFVFRLSR